MDELERSEIRKNHAIADLCEHITSILKLYMISVAMLLGSLIILIAFLILM